MWESYEIRYFLGANSPRGFYSLYSELLPPETAEAVYILKGGPGCGKSTVMGQVAARLAQAGETVEYILCSGDPASLDGVVIPRLRTALVDGTAPHVVEPKYPGVAEQYVNLGACYDRAGLQGVREEIQGAMTGYREHYQRAYRCLGAAEEIREDVRAALETPALEEKLERRARGILRRELKPKGTGQGGAVKQRFLGAVTHMGTLTLYETVQAQCTRVYELSDRYGLAHPLLSRLLAGAVLGGYDVVACPDPMAPERLAHLLVPEAGLAFVSSAPASPYPGKCCRRLRLETMADQEALRRCRPRLRFSLKVSAALVEEAVDSLAQAKAMHDGLEALYHPYVDFARGAELGERIAEEILARA